MASRVTHSPPPSVKAMAWRVIPSPVERMGRPLLPVGAVGEKEGRRVRVGWNVGGELERVLAVGAKEAGAKEEKDTLQQELQAQTKEKTRLEFTLKVSY